MTQNVSFAYKNKIKGVLGHICAHVGKTGPGEPPVDGEMTLPSRHIIRALAEMK